MHVPIQSAAAIEGIDIDLLRKYEEGRRDSGLTARLHLRDKWEAGPDEDGVLETEEDYDEAKKRGYDFTEQPIPGLTPGVGQSITSPSTSLSPTIINLVSVTIAENQKSVVTINATNPLGGSMIYALSGADSHLMTVDSDGVIVLNSDANYEEKASYSLTANVTNAKKIVAEAIKLVAEHKGDKPAAQGALFGGGSVMTARDKIPQDRLIALAPIIGNYIPATAPSTA